MSIVKLIESAQNKDYKYWLNLAKFNQSRHDNFIILEGEHLCQAWLDTYGLPEYLLLDKNLYDNNKYSNFWAKCSPIKRILIAPNLAKSLIQVINGPGIFFVVEKPVLQKPLAKSGDKLIDDLLCLDRVQDPGNLGTLFRTAAAAGINNIVLSKGCASAWSPKVLRSAQGAHFALQIYESIDLLSYLPTTGLDILCTSLDLSSDLFQTNLTKPIAWIFGNEGRGVSDELLAMCTSKVHIPQSDKIESLNVSAAAAICLFEQKRQRMAR